MDEKIRDESNAAQPAPPRGGMRGIPFGIWALGFVSMLMDVSSEMIHALLPMYSYNFV